MDKLTEKELHALVSLLDDTDWEVKSHVKNRLVSIGHEVIPFLEKKWEECFNPDLQAEIEELVHALQFGQLKTRMREWKNSSDRDLLTGLWLINTYQYPDLEFKKLQSEMNQIYFEVWTAFKNDLQPYEQIKIINSILFNHFKFSANTKNFHSPANSMLSNVLESKKGNPISLSSIYLLVAQKLGIPIYGVNLPNLFVLTYKTDDVRFYINVFNKGVVFTKKDITNYLEHLNIQPQDEFYEPCTTMDIIKRFLRNLYLTFEKFGESTKLEEVKELIAILEED